MPTFPPYHGQFPPRLNPLNLRHYLLLAYWLYFRPTAFKNYLYQADPDLYRTGPGRGIFRTWRVPAYRNLYLMAPGLILLLSIVFGLPLVLATSWLQGTPVDWARWAVGMAVGVAVGVAGGVAFGLAVGVMGGVTGGVAGGVAYGVAVGMAFGVAVGVTGGPVGGVAYGVAGGVAGGVAVGVAVGVAYGVAVGVAGGVAFGVAGGVAFGLAVGVASGVAFGVTGGLGALRAIFYLPQLIPALWLRGGGRVHPVAWDELTVLPLPRTRSILARQLQQSEPEGLRLVGEVVRNPFQRWAVQSVLCNYLHHRPAPLHFLYRILVEANLGAYVYAPVSEIQWERVPTSRQLLLGELAGQWVDCRDPVERPVWSLTRFLRDRRQTPLTQFAGLLYQCLDDKKVEAEDFDLSRHREIYTGLRDYPGDEEIAQTFETMATFLNYDQLSALPGAANATTSVTATPIRPTVLTVLARLAEVGAEVNTYQAATSRVNQLAALARASDALNDLNEYVEAEVMAPEQYILRRIIKQWQQLVIEAGGEVGRAEEIGPITNPYIFGNPVTGDLFVGRQDVLRRLEELWAGAGQCPSVVLYGHRRMGKTSILHNLGGARFGPQTIIVDFNMQRVGLVAGPGELLYNLALALYDAQATTQTFEVSKTSKVSEPDEARFIAHNPYTAFDRFLKQLDRARAGRRFIITVDEFELIEQMINEGQLEVRLLDFWRGLIQTYPWFIMAFAGLHTLQEMTQDYWHPLFGSVTAIPVSFLSPAAARQLITQPTPDFGLDYDAEAIERIIALTWGQPYLIQLIGHGLVTRFNRQTFEEGAERERRFSLADVEAVIDAPEFYRDGDAYFTGVWRQAEQGAPGQQDILRTLAKGPATTETLKTQTDLSLEQTLAALETLRRHDVVYVSGQPLVTENGEFLITESGGQLLVEGETSTTKESDESEISIRDQWDFTVELMRRWVAQRKKP